MAKHILIVVSDLHLSAVQGRVNGQCVAFEGFHYDIAFSHFVDDLLVRVRDQTAMCELLLLGDSFDFLHTKVPLTESSFLTTTEASGVQKIKAIIRAHPVFFEALNRLAATGFRLSVVPGNHDMDLMRPATRQILTESIESDSPGIISFHSWIYHVPGVLYAEHGHQYHDINAYTTLLAPYRRGHENELELPVGAYFDMYLFRLIERVKPPAENIHTPLRYLLNSYLKRPLKLITTFPDLLGFFYSIFYQLLSRSSHQFQLTRQRYQEEVLSNYAAGTGLSYPICVALDQLAQVDSIKMLHRLLDRALFKKSGDPIKDGYLYSKALVISKVLGQEGKGVYFYLFGHSHQLAKAPLDGQVDTFYLNSGTWSSPSYPGSPGNRTCFPFIEIEWEDNERPAATLMQWDETGRKSVQLEAP
jgi:UDP-2,3-diacylglucosamine pyrophosphatase LpxH